MDALVAAMAGGDLAYLLMNTNYRLCHAPFDGMAGGNRLEPRRHGWRHSGRESESDPLSLTPYVDAERVLMIMTRGDAIVPFEAQQALWRAWALPRRSTCRRDIGPRSLFPEVARTSAIEFFERQFAPERIAATR